MKRYIRDPKLREFQASIRAEVERIAALANKDAYVIYAIRDPTRSDIIRGHPHGPPVYVGQTGELRTRVENHMRDGGGGSTDNGCKTGRLKQIIDQWHVPKFEILDRAPTRLTSLIAETVWARRFVWLGYELANQWPEHRTTERPEGLASVPRERLWDFTIRNALEDEVRLTLECRRCDILDDVDLSDRPPTVLLKSVRSLKLKCGLCGGPLFMDAKRPDPTSWRWRTYRPAPMLPRTRSGPS